MRYHLTPIGIIVIYIKKITESKCGKDVETWNPCALLVGLQNAASGKENSVVVPQKIKHANAIGFASVTSECTGLGKSKFTVVSTLNEEFNLV